MVAIKDKEFKQFADYVKQNYGINFKHEKKSLIEGRLGQVMTQLGFDCIRDYLDYVKADKTGQAEATMLNKITTNHTYFMREPAHFYYFRDKVLPYLEATVKDMDLRIWSAACSSGEEPYTLAMLIDEYFGPKKSFWDAKILATDISANVLGQARQGVYSNEKIKPLPGHWQKKYFKKYDAEKSIISEKMRQEVIFSNFNLITSSFPFKKKMHVIFCRNVMIYFDNPTKDRLIEQFYDLTQPGGFLFIGHSESLDREKTRYKYVMPSVYRKE